jgi:hypothetical protein
MNWRTEGQTGALQRSIACVCAAADEPLPGFYFILSCVFSVRVYAFSSAVAVPLVSIMIFSFFHRLQFNLCEGM